MLIRYDLSRSRLEIGFVCFHKLLILEAYKTGLQGDFLEVGPIFLDNMVPSAGFEPTTV
jgi:hypothetical protein